MNWKNNQRKKKAIKKQLKKHKMEKIQQTKENYKSLKVLLKEDKRTITFNQLNYRPKRVKQQQTETNY